VSARLANAATSSAGAPPARGAPLIDALGDDLGPYPEASSMAVPASSTPPVTMEVLRGLFANIERLASIRPRM
jgi:hypothetical protein